MTKPTTAAAERTRQPIVGKDVQPQSLPSLRASTTGTRITAIRIVPSRSMERGRSGSRDSPTVNMVTGMQTAAIAASIQNKPCQPVESTRRPPTNGPSAAPAADAAPHNVIAFIWAAPDAATESRLMPQARMVEPAAPWIIRPMMTPAPCCESAMSTQDATKRIRP